MGFKIDFLGLIYFYYVGRHERRLLLPYGRDGMEGIAPHYCSFFLETERVRDDSKWQPLPPSDLLKDLRLSEYTIDCSSTLCISGVDTASGCMSLGMGGGVKGSIESSMAHLKECATPPMNIVPDKAITIAQMPIRQGFLEAFRLGTRHTLVSRLTITNYHGPITITATGGKGRKIIKVDEGTEIVLSNTSDLVGSHGHGMRSERSHSDLYSKLADDGQSHTVTISGAPKLPELPSSQRYIVHLKGKDVMIPGPDCGNTCC